MWFLVGQNNTTGLECWIDNNKPVIVGRKDCGLMITNDVSVSRIHTSLWTDKKKDRSNKKGVATVAYIRDEKSSCGTFVNKKRIEGPQTELKDGDKVGIGSITQFRVQYCPIVICYSMVASSTQTKLTQLARLMDVQTTNEWDATCTHLLMDKLCVTEKVTLALIHGVPIVTSGWLRALVSDRDALIKQGRLAIPDPTLFLPRIVDPNVSSDISFDANPRRQRLFVDRVCVTFSDEQYERVDRIISASGGKTIHCRIGDEVAATTVAITEYCRAWHGLCIIEPQEADHVDLVRRAAERLGKSLVSEQDINLAILHVSTTVYCNGNLSTAAVEYTESDADTTVMIDSLDSASNLHSPSHATNTNTEPKIPSQLSLNEAFKYARSRADSQKSAKFSSLLENMMSTESSSKVPAVNIDIKSTVDYSDASHSMNVLKADGIINENIIPVVTPMTEATSKQKVVNHKRNNVDMDANTQLLEQDIPKEELLLSSNNSNNSNSVEIVSLVKTSQSTTSTAVSSKLNTTTNYKRFKKVDYYL
ncbi:hypothetical protein BDF19DRAFT_429545 [Syncephalis fuscata]|nr:hypothetical protein BDF19DRAFT_429545 [Syncephalis fuscata]